MKPLLLAFASIFLPALQVRADNPAQAEQVMRKLIAATTAKDYPAFIADGTDEVKAALSKPQFEAVAAMVEARFKAGYDLAALGELNQKGFEVYLYRLRFKDSGDDMLATLSLKDGKVGGIFFH